MKILLSILLTSLFITSSVDALTVLNRVDSPRQCPDSLQIKITALKGKPDQFKVEILFVPEPAATHTVRVFNKLMVLHDEKLLADAPLDVIRDGHQYRSQLRLHKDALEHSKVSVSMYLVERNGMPILGGGHIYEISLKGFIFPQLEDEPESGTQQPLIENTLPVPAESD